MPDNLTSYLSEIEEDIETKRLEMCHLIYQKLEEEYEAQTDKDYIAGILEDSLYHKDGHYHGEVDD